MTTKGEEVASKALSKMAQGPRFSDGSGWPGSFPILAKFIDDAIAETIERCAKEADRPDCGEPECNNADHRAGPTDVSRRIRALATPETAGRVVTWDLRSDYSFPLKDALREEFGTGDKRLDAGDLPFLRGLRAAKVGGAEELIGLIEKHGAIVVWEES